MTDSLLPAEQKSLEVAPIAKVVALSAKNQGRPSSLLYFLKRHLTPRLGLALTLWQGETRTAALLATALVITFGQWPAAFAMGGIMAAYSALFLFLLQGEPAMEAFREWARSHRLVRSRLLPAAQRQDSLGWLVRLAGVPLLIMLTGPFWRAIILQAFSVRRPLSYLISVGGSIPHSLFWTGVVLGGLWENLIWPFLDSGLA